MEDRYSVYKIVNTINGKVYIGQTINTIEKRFKEHLHRARYESNIVRPLYNAIRKYGEENFKIYMIETNLTKIEANEKEKYWIKKYDSFGEHGYNATDGGDDGSYNAKYVLQIEPETYRIINKFRSTHEAGRYIGKTNSQIQRVCSGKRRICGGYHWIYQEDYEANIKNFPDRFLDKRIKREVMQLDMHTGKKIAEYSSCYEVERKCGYKSTYIRRACAGERKTCYGFIWKFKK